MAMDFTSAGARVRSLIASKKPQQLSASALPRDVLRDNIVEETIADSPRFRSVVESKPTIEWDRPNEDGSTTRESFEWEGFGEAVRDVARAGYQYDEPEVLARGQVRPSGQLGRELVSRVLRSPDFVESRPYTRENADESSFGAQSAAHELVRQAPEIAEHLARSEEMRDQEEEITDAEQLLEELRGQAREQHNEIFGIDPDLVQQVKDQVRRREDARDKLAELIAEQQAAGSGALGNAAKAVAAAFEEGVEAAHLASLFAGNAPGQAHNRAPGAQIALAEKIAEFPQLRKILREVGRMVNSMRFKRQARSRNVAVEPVGITTGREITRLLPHELARMQVPALQALWLNDWSNRSLLEWEMGGKEPAGKGPTIPVYDGSASMSEKRKIDWAHALVLATLILMQRERRDFACVEFGYGASELKSWFFPAAEQPDPDRVIDMATHFFHGGTDITIGLAEAKRIIDEVPAFKTADIILISDGQDAYGPEDVALVRELDKMGVRIHGISILTPNNRYLAQACEYVVDVVDLFGSDDATDALAENLT